VIEYMHGDDRMPSFDAILGTAALAAILVLVCIPLWNILKRDLAKPVEPVDPDDDTHVW
jgi:hypothetical protein